MKKLVRPLVVVLVALLAGIALLAISRTSLAQVGGGTGPMPRHFPHSTPTPQPSQASAVPGKIRLSAVDGARGPVVLTPKSGGFVGEFVVWNDGQGPLTVSRVAVRSDDDDPRLPPRFNARFADGGGGSSVIQPHSSKRVNITWIPDHDPKVHEALGHVVLTSSDEAAGEVAMGFVSPLGGPLSPLTGHLLTCLLFLPLFGAIVAFAMHVVGHPKDEKLRGLTVALTAAQCLLAVVLYQGFSGVVTRVDGNDGFQFVERSVLLHAPGIEYFVGVDGISVSLVLLLSLLGFVGALASYGLPRARAPRGLALYYGLYSLLLAATMGVFVALDLALFAAMWVTMLVTMIALVATSAGELRRRTTMILGGIAVASCGLLVFATAMLYAHSDPTFLADGSRAAHTFALPELMRVAYNAKHLELFGCSWVKVVWVALFLAFALVIPLVPLHGWFVRALAEVPAPVAVVLAGVVVKTGLYGLLRVSVGVLPDGTRWAATTLVAFGLVNIAFVAFALVLPRARSLAELIAYSAFGQIGFCLVGLGAMTREGVAGCLFQMVSHGLLVAVLFVLLGVLRDRAKTSDVAELGRLARRVPFFLGPAVVALLGLAGAPGLGGFWGETLPILGAFPVQRTLATLTMTMAVGMAASQLRAFRAAFAGTTLSETSSETAAAPFATRELSAFVPLLLLCAALGMYPAPFFALVQGGVSDVNQLVNPAGPDEIALADVSDGG